MFLKPAGGENRGIQLQASVPVHEHVPGHQLLLTIPCFNTAKEELFIKTLNQQTRRVRIKMSDMLPEAVGTWA